jgi:transcriptional regulator with XRE-family HTH domain
MTFNPDALTRIRKQRGWSQVELAHAAKVDPGTVSRLEHGQRPNPTITTIFKLSEALDTPIETLIVFSETRS